MSITTSEPMTRFEILSQEANYQFPEKLFEIMPEDHFWVCSRFKVFLQEIRKLEIDLTDRKLGFDIGCAHGMVQRQLTAHSAWFADGCDLITAGLSKNYGHNGRVSYYNIMDRRPEFEARYDFLVIFDVLEHIEDTTLFLEAASFHLKPDGYIFVNVPAMGALHSKFDEVLGHLRRYDKRLLSQHLIDAHLDVLSVRYWAVTMIPVIFARGLLVKLFTDPDKILRIGFKPPGRLISALLSGLLSIETWALRFPIIGTCLFAIAKKPSAQAERDRLKRFPEPRTENAPHGRSRLQPLAHAP
jgi:2-polyprenyl-3-methyl-5-hydroxy-6-metoxy-1,4-benzoquinol methylase